MPNGLQNSEKSSNIGKIGGNEENIEIFTIILMASFGNRNVHRALARLDFRVCIYYLMYLKRAFFAIWRDINFKLLSSG